MIIAIMAVTVAALLYTLRQNRRLASQLAALAARQDQADERINQLTRKTKKATVKQRQFDRRIEQQHKRQERLAKAQEQIRKDQRKQAEMLRKTQFKLEQATGDIEAAKLRLSSLYSLLDIALSNQAVQMPGSPADYRYQKQITSLQHSISIAERQFAKAKFERDNALRQIDAA